MQAFSVPQSFPRDNHYNSSFDGSYLRGTSFAGATTIPRSSSYFISANHSSHGAPSGFGTARNQYDSLGHVSPPFLYPPPSVGPQFPTGIQQQEQHHHLSNSTPFFYAQLSVSPHRMKGMFRVLLRFSLLLFIHRNFLFQRKTRLELQSYKKHFR